MSLQCLISALTQVDGGGLLLRFSCSVVLYRGRGTADKYHWRVWGVLTMFWPHWVCPHSWHVCFPRLHCSGSRLLSRERALICTHFPGLSCSGSCFFGTPQKHRLSFVPSPAGAAQTARSLTSALSPGVVFLIPSAVPASVSGRAGLVRLVSLLWSWSLAATLPVDVNHPESQEVFG